MQRSIQCFLIGKRLADETELPASTSSSAKRQSQFAADTSSMHPSDSEEEENVWLDDSGASESEGDDDNLQPPVINVDSVAATCEAQAEQRATSKLINKPPGPSDISAGRTDEPRQPKLSTFPSTQFGKKRRAFSARWYELYSWLEYSVSQDAAFCFSCRLFPVPSRTMLENTFTVSGYRQWKKAIEKDSGFAQHERSDYHKATFCAWKDFQSQIESGKSIDIALVSAHEKQIKENRYYVKQVGKVLCLTARQKIAQRGHREDSGSSNRGNFLEILQLVSEYDSIVKQRLAGIHSVKYTSPEIQTEMLEILACIIRDEICKELHVSTDYSVMVDESKDISGKEQLSLVVRYLFQNNIHEEFLDFAHLHELNAKYLKEKMIQILKSCNIDPKDCVGQTYDGASVMSGVNKGVQVLFKEDAPRAEYTHCYNHRLNLVIVDCVKSVKLADKFFGFLESLYVFMSSHVPHELFVKNQEEMYPRQQVKKLKKLSDTRWSCQYLSCKVLLDTLPVVMATLKEIAETHTGKRAHDANSLLKNIDHSIVTSIVMFTSILQKTKLLSDMLQSPSLELSAAADMIQTVEEDLASKRNEECWHELWVKAEGVRNQVDIPVEDPAQKRMTRPSRCLQDSMVLESTGQRNIEDSYDSLEKKYCVNLYYEVLDRLLVELHSRFSDANKKLLKSMSVLDPRSSNFLDLGALKPMTEQYCVDVEYLDVELRQARRLVEKKKNEGLIVGSLVELSAFMSPYKEAFPDLCKLINIALVLPPTSASCERSFSSMRLIKSYLRSTMSDTRLSSLGVIGIHPNRAKDIDMEHFVSMFAQKHNNRKIQLF